MEMILRTRLKHRLKRKRRNARTIKRLLNKLLNRCSMKTQKRRMKGNGRAFSANGDLKMFYEHISDDTCLEVVYRVGFAIISTLQVLQNGECGNSKDINSKEYDQLSSLSVLEEETIVINESCCTF